MANELFSVGDVIVETEPGRDLRVNQYATITDILMPEDDEDGVGFYTVDSRTVTNGVIEFPNAKRVMTVEEAQEKLRLPTIQEVQQFLSSAVLDDYENITINETEKISDSKLLIHGQTRYQVPFHAEIHIMSVRENDFW